jgi:hypothetical protein
VREIQTLFVTAPTPDSVAESDSFLFSMINFYYQNKESLLRIRRSYFFSSQLLSSFQRITSQNQVRITSPDSVAFDTTHQILIENQKLRAVPNRPKNEWASEMSESLDETSRLLQFLRQTTKVVAVRPGTVVGTIVVR